MTNEELANELERLAKERSPGGLPSDWAAHQRLWDHFIANLPAIISALRENARMREALEAIASCRTVTPGDVVDVARAALRHSVT